MPIGATDQVLELQLHWKMDGQKLINQFHYYAPAGTWGQTLSVMNTLSQAIWNSLTGDIGFLGAFSPELVLDHVTTQLVAPTRFAKGRNNFAAGVPGTRAGDPLQSSVQASITTQTDAAGPGGHGGNRWAGLVVADVVDSLVTDVYQGDLDVGVAQFYTIPAWLPGAAKPLVYNRLDVTASNPIVSYIIEDEARVLRRRVVGRGK